MFGWIKSGATKATAWGSAGKRALTTGYNVGKRTLTAGYGHAKTGARYSKELADHVGGGAMEGYNFASTGTRHFLTGSQNKWVGRVAGTAMVGTSSYALFSGTATGSQQNYAMAKHLDKLGKTMLQSRRAANFQQAEMMTFSRRRLRRNRSGGTQGLPLALNKLRRGGR